MKIYKKVVIVLSIIVNIVITVLSFTTTPSIVASLKGRTITEAEYNELKEVAVLMAKGLDIENKDIQITKTNTENAFIVKVDADLYGIEAEFPIENYSEERENGVILSQGTIDFNNANYKEYTSVQSPLSIVFKGIIGTAGLAFISYYILVEVPFMIKTLITDIVEYLTKKYSNQDPY